MGEDMKDYKIIIDTREQKPLWKEGKAAVIGTLKTGDYSIVGYEDKIAIERKSLMDLFGTLGKGHKRFKKELERALELDYFAIIIEGSYSSASNKDFDGSCYSKMKGDVVTSILITIHVKYKVPIFFTNGRIETKRIIKEILNSYSKIYIE